jgi:hypothetical protein
VRLNTYYTVGCEEIYDRALAQGGVRKMGRRDACPGGCVFATVADAEDYIVERGLQGYAVYELECDDFDVIWGSDGRIILVRDSLIAGKVET